MFFTSIFFLTFLMIFPKGFILTMGETHVNNSKCPSLWSVNPFPNKPWFLRVCSTSLLKTPWKKEKLLVTSNFSFSTVFSTRLEIFLLFSSNLKLSSAKSFSLEESKICRLGKG